jgi:KDO2-lipid IV(A) lauroyltransferase
MTAMLTHLGFGFLWLFHWLPLGLQAAIGNGLGWLAYLFTKRRKRIAQRNLELCFPEESESERRRLLRQNLQASVRAALEHGLLIWASAARLERLIRIEGREHLDAWRGQPVILLAPHFVGLDMGGVRLSTELKVASMYSRSRNAVVDHYLLKSRTRFTQATLASRHEGIRPLIRIIQSGLPFYYLPDQDYGRRESIFVPFFGIPAATVPALARLAKVTGAKVVPAVTRQLPGGQGYVLRFYPAWENYPSGDIEADTRRMNAFIEDRIREMPEQYLWTHRRFKTRPEGGPGLYD